jgi:hypothetical protein
LLVKDDKSPPSIVLLFAIVGSFDVFQHTPPVTIGAPPSFVILPPETAVVVDISVTIVVVNEGISGLSSQDCIKIIESIIPRILRSLFMILI